MKGALLKAAREKAEWTQVKLAKRLGVTQVYVSLMEPGNVACRPVMPID